MNIQPKFGSEYKVRMLTRPETPEEHKVNSNFTSAYTKITDLDGVSLSSGNFDYIVTLKDEDGVEQQKIVQVRSDETHSNYHFSATGAGSEIDRSLREAPKWKEVLSQLPLINKVVKPQEVITVEEHLDRQVEAILEKHGIEYEKKTFEEL